MRLDLIVTGELEFRALGPALVRWGEASGIAIEIGQVHKVPSITNVAIPRREPWAKGLLGKTDEVVRTMLAALDANQPPDLVLFVDDLEIHNAGNAEAVHGVLRAEIDRRMLNAAQALRLRTSASVHLAVPMIEAWFFGDPAALAAAGSKEGCGRWDLNGDPERFEVVDAEFAAWHVEKFPNSPEGFGARHPKRYLDFLCRPQRYREVESSRWRGPTGQVALVNLDWEVVTSEAPRMNHLRELFEDLAAAVRGAVPDRRGNFLRNA